jgi:hypothetical protein
VLQSFGRAQFFQLWESSLGEHSLNIIQNQAQQSYRFDAAADAKHDESYSPWVNFIYTATALSQQMMQQS